MIYQLANKRIEISSLATSHMYNFATSLIIVTFKSNNFYQNRPKIKFFWQKNHKIFKRWGLRPQTPETAPTVIVDFLLRAWLHTAESFQNTAYCSAEDIFLCFENNLNVVTSDSIMLSSVLILVFLPLFIRCLFTV